MENNIIIKKLGKGAVLLFLLCSTSLFAQNTWYVSTSGDDENGTGTNEKPWKSPGYAASQVTNAGDTIKLMPGTYSLQTQIVLNNGVSLIGSGKEGDNKTVINASWNLDISNLKTGLYLPESIDLEGRSHLVKIFKQ